MEKKGFLRSAATITCLTPAKPPWTLLEDKLNHLLPPQVHGLCLNFRAQAAGSHLLISRLLASLYPCIPMGTGFSWLNSSTPKQRLWTTVLPLTVT